MDTPGKDRQRRLWKKLEGEKARLQAQIAQITMAGGEGLGYGNHMADDATEAFEQAKGLALRQHLERLLQQVERALEKMAAGTYGICEQCGQAIDPARLKALPHALLCLDCQQRRERI